jgi:protein-S-isoprenylcysteine O-methyltransferase Ste14
MTGRTSSDLVLLGVTTAELALLLVLTPTFTILDWIYAAQHLFILGVALTRRPPAVQDRSLRSNVAVVVAYAYPYAQLAYLRWVPGNGAWPEGGLVIVMVAACLSLASLLTIGKSFGVRPAVRDLSTNGPYRVVRHPLYLSYILADVGFNLQEWNTGTVLLVIAGWTALLYRIRAEEHLLSRHLRWPTYAARVPYRLFPFIW